MSRAELDDIPAPEQPAARVRALLEAEGARLLGYFARRVDPRHHAADLVAESMLIVWQRADRLPADPEQARMWLYGVARNVLANHLRRARRHSALADRLRTELIEQEADGARDEPEMVRRLRDALETLPAQDREIVTLVHWDGFTLAEVARLLGVPAATVRSRSLRLRARLRTELDPARRASRS